MSDRAVCLCYPCGDEALPRETLCAVCFERGCEPGGDGDVRCLDRATPEGDKLRDALALLKKP